MLVLNEMVLVLVLETRGSSTSTSTAGAEHEYENHGTSRRSGTRSTKKCNFKTHASGWDERAGHSPFGRVGPSGPERDLTGPERPPLPRARVSQPDFVLRC